MLYLAALLLLIVMTVALPAQVFAQAAESLYRQALEDRRNGDFGAAIDKLESALQSAPRDVDVLLLLGQIYGFEERFDEALQVLARAQSLAPDYIDVDLAIARIHSYQGRFALAEREARSILDEDPDNHDAVILTARLAYYQGDLDAAEAAFARARELAPDSLESLVGLGDVAMARGDRDSARSHYRRAAELQPDAAEIQVKLARAEARDPLWRLDTGVRYSRFSGDGREPWRESLNRLTYQLTPETAIHARVDLSERFGLGDIYYEGGVVHDFAPWLNAGLAAGGTPGADFRERWAVLADVATRVSRGGTNFGGTVLTLRGKAAEYDTGNVESVDPGVEQYFFDGRLWFTGRWTNTLDEQDEYLAGWLARIDLQAHETLRVYGGVSDTPETRNNTTVQTQAVFFGAIVEVTRNVTLRVDVAHEDTEGSAARTSVFSGIAVSF